MHCVNNELNVKFDFQKGNVKLIIQRRIQSRYLQTIVSALRKVEGLKGIIRRTIFRLKLGKSRCRDGCRK